MNTSEARKDWIISIGVLSQPIWLLLQHSLIFLLNVDLTSSTQYRVVLVAIPLILALIISVMRKPVMFFFTYLVVVSLLLLTIAIFPDNSEYVKSQSMRFLLPVVVPSTLCLVCVKNFEVVRKTLYFVSWICASIGIILGITFFGGVWRAQGYNMSLSYGLLLPMVFLFSQRRIINYIVSFFLFLFVLAIGSRGAVFCFIIYILFELIGRRSWWSILLLFILIVLYLNISFVDNWFLDLGISSRTMNMYNSDEFAADSGRAAIRSYFIAQLLQHPFLGIGLFGDRTVSGIAYCHNVFLEILLDFGFLMGGAIIFWFILFVIKEYRRCSEANKILIIASICIFFLPLMFSGSYLIDYSMGVFLGILVLVHKQTCIMRI